MSAEDDEIGSHAICLREDLAMYVWCFFQEKLHADTGDGLCLDESCKLGFEQSSIRWRQRHRRDMRPADGAGKPSGTGEATCSAITADP